jgi:BlaI family penicillinase repressor
MAKTTPREPELTDAEWRVMNAVWRCPEATARSVLEELRGETGWAYSTVKTQMDRLVQKGVLKARMEGITTVYTPVLGQRRARRTALQGLLRRAFGGAAGSLAHFLLGSERLTERERRELMRLLEKQGGAKP